jgi:molecular chaperone HscB
MSPDFTRNHFELFDLPVAFAIDLERLDRDYREVQGRVHPDRFAAAPESERRLSMQWATQANEAYRTLREPLLRARYLLALKGYDTAEEDNTAMPADFLMEQMEWREQSADARAARDTVALEALRNAIEARRAAMHVGLERSLGSSGNYEAACVLVRKLRFLDKIAEEVRDALHYIEDAAR